MLLDTELSHSSGDLIAEARRQIEICNACRYCEGFCSVFPAMTRQNAFADGDITQLANLCHNCRGCYYSCQYTPPHEFALNLPAALAEVRQDSWERLIRPRGLARMFHAQGVALSAAMVLGFALLFMMLIRITSSQGEGFYDYLAHGVMVVVFLPAFVATLIVATMGVRDYWRETGALSFVLADLGAGLRQAAQLRNLGGGQGQGCNFEKEDRYTDARRWAHQLVMYGFLLCFASTSVATLMHYLLNMPAPYPISSPPKLLGLTGGVGLVMGTGWMAVLKWRADPELGARRVWGSEMAFVLLLGAVAATGLLLYAATGTAAVGWLLAIHLGSVLTLFLLMPFTKMVHPMFRLAALTAEAAAARVSRR